MVAKVLYVTAQLPCGVGEGFLLEELRNLRDLGVTLTLCPLRPTCMAPNPDFEDMDGIGLEIQPVLGVRVLLGAAIEWVRHPIQVLSLFNQAVLRARNHDHFLRNLAAFPKALWMARLLRRGHFDHLHVNWLAQQATSAWIASRLANIPWSFTAHRWDIDSNNMLREKLGAAAVGRFISEEGRRRCLALAGGAGEENTHVLHLGVAVPPIGTRDIHATAGEWRLLAVGNLIPVKGHSYLIEALRRLRELNLRLGLDIVGDGPLLGELQRLAHAYGLADSLRIVRPMRHSELLSLMRSGEYLALVHPSVVTEDGAHEGIPVVLMEAMAAGLPVVSTFTGGIPELVEDGAGLLVQERDAAALAEAVSSLITQPMLRHRMRESAYQRVRDRFNAQRSAAVLASWFGGVSPR